MSVADKVIELNNIRHSIRQQLQDLGSDMPAGLPFDQYATKISKLESSPIEWSRPTDWLPYPETTTGTISLLIGIVDTLETVFKLRVTGSSLFIDWGTGDPAVSVTSGSVIEYTYVYGDIPVETTTSLGYRQVRITLTGNITGIDFTANSTQERCPILEAIYDVNTLTGVTSFGNPTCLYPLLQHMWVKDFGGTSLSSLEVPDYWVECITVGPNPMPSVVTIDSWLTYRNQITTIRFLAGTLVNVTNASYCCRGCFTLTSVIWETGALPAIEDMSYMFNNCSALLNLKFPAGSLTQVATLNNCFANSQCLRSVTFPAGSLANVINMNRCFNYCPALKELIFPENSLSQVTNITSMFETCYVIRRVHFPNNALSAVTAANFAFWSCYQLESITFSTGAFSNVTTASGCFNFCEKLTSLIFPAGAFQVLTNATNMFGECRALEILDCGSSNAFALVTSAGGMLSSLRSLRYVNNLNLPVSFSVANGLLDADVLNSMFTSLPTVVGQTITLTGNPGTSQPGYDPSIATAKGWTVIS